MSTGKFSVLVIFAHFTGRIFIYHQKVKAFLFMGYVNIKLITQSYNNHLFKQVV